MLSFSFCFVWLSSSILIVVVVNLVAGCSRCLITLLLTPGVSSWKLQIKIQFFMVTLQKLHYYKAVGHMTIFLTIDLFFYLLHCFINLFVSRHFYNVTLIFWGILDDKCENISLGYEILYLVAPGENFTSNCVLRQPDWEPVNCELRKAIYKKVKISPKISTHP